MKYAKIYLICVFLYTVVFSFAQNQLITIDLTKAKEATPMSKLFDKVEYVALETNKNCLLKPTAAYYVTKDYIIAMNIFYNTYLFDRKTGKYIREIGSEGGGPEEYQGFMLYYNGLDEKKNVIYAVEHEQWKGYDIETGKMCDLIKKPVWKGDLINIPAPFSIDNNRYIGTVVAESIEEEKSMVTFDRKGAVDKIYPKTASSNVLRFSGLGIFYKYSGNNYFYETCFSDTVYYICDNKLLPHIIFKTGNRKDVYERSNDTKYVSDQKSITNVCETNHFVFFNYILGHDQRTIYNGVYDKYNKTVYIAQTKNINERHYGYVNDIDGLSAFSIKGMNSQNEVYGPLDAEILSNYLDSDALKMSERARKLVANLQEDDNPILVIATPK